MSNEKKAGRLFEDRHAVREETPLIIGLVGPSGSGKTKSALRLADGFRRVRKGKTFVVDTEQKRSLHHAGEHDFEFVPFGEPFGPADYIAAFRHCVSRGAARIICDSMSHEWEGVGGVLDMHDQEVERLGASMTFPAWGKPKREHNRLKQFILQQPVDWILCFRSKEKLKKNKAVKEPVEMGWMPLGGEDLIYECTAKFLLYPQCDGVPTLKTDMPGERQLIKIPGQFRHMFQQPAQLTEDIGEQFARWASGTASSPDRAPAGDLVSQLLACEDAETLKSLQDVMKSTWDSIPKGEARTKVTRAFKDAEARVRDNETARAAGSSDDDKPPMTADEIEEIKRAELERSK